MVLLETSKQVVIVSKWGIFMKPILRLLIFGLIISSPIVANPAVQSVFEDVVVRFEQEKCGQKEVAIYTKAFQLPHEDTAAYTPLYAVKEDANYESGDMLCVRAYAYIEAAEGLFKKVLLGLALITKDSNSQDSLYIEYLCVDPIWQRCGIGKTIITALENHFKPKAIRLFSIQTAINFYKKLGFEREHDWSNNMIKKL